MRQKQDQRKLKTYLYLARRDKKGIKMLTVLPHGKEGFLPTRIENINILGLPEGISKELGSIIYKERMMWEVFLECSENYDTLAESLRKRGYESIPMHFAPISPIVGSVDGNKVVKYPEPTMRDIDKKKIMLQKKK